MSQFKFLNNNPTNIDYLRDYLRRNIAPSIRLSDNVDVYMEGVEVGMMTRGLNPWLNPYDDLTKSQIWYNGFWNATNLIRKRNGNI